MTPPFVAILQAMVERVPGATGAIFVDWEGEAVGTFAPDLAPLDMEIIGAQWGLVWSHVQRALERARLGFAHEMIVDGARGSVVVRKVTNEYYVVLTIRHDSHLATALREIQRTAESLRAEM